MATSAPLCGECHQRPSRFRDLGSGALLCPVCVIVVAGDEMPPAPLEERIANWVTWVVYGLAQLMRGGSR